MAAAGRKPTLRCRHGVGVCCKSQCTVFAIQNGDQLRSLPELHEIANGSGELREQEAEERLKLERMQLGSEMRKTVNDSAQATSEELAQYKEEVRKLQQELERERTAARDAEAKAAKQQAAAVLTPNVSPDVRRAIELSVSLSVRFHREMYICSGHLSARGGRRDEAREATREEEKYQ